MAYKRRKILLATILLAALAVGFVTMFVPGPNKTQLPNPNGYDDLVKAGGVINKNVSDYPDMSRESLSELVASNREGLALGRLGLSRKCRMPPMTALLPNGITYLMGIKRLAQAFAAEGRLAQLQGQNEYAIRCYLDSVRLGNESCRGGLLIDHLVGIACQGIGIAQLNGMVSNLNCAEMRFAISNLTEINNNPVPFAETKRAERRFVFAQIKEYRNPVRLFGDLVDAHRVNVKADERIKKTSADLRILMTELAIRCYVSEQGRAPESLDRLVPRYISSIPTDPFDGGPFNYRLDGTNWSIRVSKPEKMREDGIGL